MSTEYKSVEQRIIEHIPSSVKNKLNSMPHANFIKEFTQALYAHTISAFRIPTLMRKVQKKQALLYRIHPPTSLSGRISGVALGAFAFLSVYSGVANEALHGNYSPLLALTALNALSFGYEMHRGELFNDTQKVKGEQIK